MNIYPSREKQNISTDVYIDGSLVTASRIDIDSLIKMPFPTTKGEYLCTSYGDSICLLFNKTYGSYYDGDGVYVLNNKTWDFYTASSSSRMYIRAIDSYAIFYSDDLHLFRRNNSGNLLDYIWDGTSLGYNTTFSRLYPSDYYNMVEYHNELYLIADPNGSTITESLVKLDMLNNTFSIVATGNIEEDSRLVVYNDEIHILGGTSHYKWDGSALSSVSTIPFDIDRGMAITWNSKIHIFKGFLHYSWDGIQWSQEENTLFTHPNNSRGIAFDDKIYLFGQEYVKGIETISAVSIKDVTIS